MAVHPHCCAVFGQWVAIVVLATVEHAWSRRIVRCRQAGRTTWIRGRPPAGPRAPRAGSAPPGGRPEPRRHRDPAAPLRPSAGTLPGRGGRPGRPRYGWGRRATGAGATGPRTPAGLAERLVLRGGHHVGGDVVEEGRVVVRFPGQAEP